MKLHFDANLDYQLEAVEAVCDLFRGQESCRGEFTVAPAQAAFAFHQGALGVGNRLLLLQDELLANLQAVQLRHGLPPSSALAAAPDFTVEMETGTGKTYVYLRTIFELNRRYGLTKFVIVVPSVAIKEGVYKSLQIMDEHFRSLYANVTHEYFLYDSSQLGQVRNFATSPNIQIMVVTVGAINKKDVNNLYKDSEKTGGDKPIDLIKATRPILIVDEPQSVDGGLEGRGREALAAMDPLCSLRYSATHRDLHHMAYRLDAVDAYERGLVKQIEVAAATIEGGHNKPYVKLLAVISRRGDISAKVELDVQGKTGVLRKAVAVRDGDDLQAHTEREIYRDCRVGEIRVGAGRELLELRAPGAEAFLRPGEEFGGPEPLAVQRQMIRRTVKEHLEKELRLAPLGIKVLSLFFVDRVEKYRRYDAEGNPQPGEYASIFEEEYRRLAAHPDFSSLFAHVDVKSEASHVHDGYFSVDRTNKRLKDTRGDTQADDDTYQLIMRDKEKLLSFDSPLKFIFSHSALREGWDNPNVFQICALREMGSQANRRQTIGRGLRLAVNQQGERLHGSAVNTLTVIATEGYQQFAAGLQHELSEAGLEFGVVADFQFAGVEVPGDRGPAPLGYEASKELWRSLCAAGYLDTQGRVQDALRVALRDGTLALPEPFLPQLPQIAAVLRKAAGRVEIRDADARRRVKPREAVLRSAEFKALWDRIKQKTTYRVQFDNERLITRCAQALADAPTVARARLQWTTAGLRVERAGVTTATAATDAPSVLDERDIPLPDLLTELQDKTHLTRRSLWRILASSGRFDDFPRNPQQFLSIAAEAINRAKRLAIVDGIKYQRRGADACYAQELFETSELVGYLKSMVQASKAVFEDVVVQSEVEARFAEQLEKNQAVKVYAKLPGWFQIATPLGPYNPDWAVLIERDGAERLYFVVETKGGLFADDLREKENAKIHCGKAHFAALATGENPARFVIANQLSDLFSEIS
ncbi:MAG TPA: DEAD/DEAH box helicase family protein [Terriglobales bacterium]|nr:DEAD/DEAH box helicase family protein [Terriglobales bacterium]